VDLNVLQPERGTNPRPLPTSEAMLQAFASKYRFGNVWYATIRFALVGKGRGLVPRSDGEFFCFVSDF
jgi:hypothetical protein